MERVMGIGGICFKAADKASLGKWYRDNLGVAVEESWGGAIFHWKGNNPKGDAHTVWSPFANDTDYFAPSTKGFMVNFRVADLHAMLDQLRANGCDVDEKVEESDHGSSAGSHGPEGNRIELWEPPEGPAG
jgi:predicted enzyme related to lactoylglutathione lyase